MTILYSVADQTGDRGAGLGNELIAWAKSYMAAHELGRSSCYQNGPLANLTAQASVLLLGVHVRGGDFIAALPKSGEFNRVLPHSWYIALMDAIRTDLEGNVRILLCSDLSREHLCVFEEMEDVELVRGSGPSAPVQELMVLAECDALICSVSSFSLLAAFLSGAPYFWYSPQLTVHPEGVSLWGGEEAQRAPGSTTSKNRAATPVHPGRGYPWAEGDALGETVERLRENACQRDKRRDLIYYGVVPK
jgi:hypothetical protein